ncbi:MAG: hypothetical protein ABFS21_00625 [Actinomycetota bacterium]
MTMLIPDARRGLFGGLFDHGALLGPSPDGLADAVDEYRELRGGPNGWMMGRFVVPASRLQELAGLLVRTMVEGEMPWSLTVVFDGEPARDAAVAASVHAVLDPAASINIAQVSTRSTDLGDIEEAVVAAAGVHQEVLPMVRLRASEAVAMTESIAHMEKRLLRSIGAGIVMSDTPPNTPALATALQRLVERDVTFTYEVDHVAALTDTDTGRVGVVNLLAGVGLHGEPDTAEILAGCDPSAVSIGFGGLRWSGRTGRASTRTPLLSIASRSSGAVIDELRTVGLGT